MKLSVDRKHIPLLATAGVLLALFVTAALLYRGFGSMRVVSNLFSDNAVLGVTAMGMTFVILSGGIDLSVGSIVAFTTVLIAALVGKHGWHPLAAMPAALLLGTAFGWFQGALVQRYELPAFLVTLGGMFFARGMAFVISMESVGIRHPFYSALQELRIPLGGKAGLTSAGMVFLAIFLLAVFVAHFTVFGRNVYAVGGNAESARLMGLPIAQVVPGVYAVSGLCSALGGVVATLYTGSGNPSTGSGLELDAIAAVAPGLYSPAALPHTITAARRRPLIIPPNLSLPAPSHESHALPRPVTLFGAHAALRFR
jgi:ribose/xylose/arabinose/galactoside ABC-type transport system permease subunit